PLVTTRSHARWQQKSRTIRAMEPVVVWCPIGRRGVRSQAASVRMAAAISATLPAAGYMAGSSSRATRRERKNAGREHRAPHRLPLTDIPGGSLGFEALKVIRDELTASR